jgi:hypothetical protein
MVAKTEAKLTIWENRFKLSIENIYNASLNSKTATAARHI